MNSPQPQLFRRAIVRAPSANFAEGLTTVDFGAPDYDRALEQHAAYCVALEQCGLDVLHLEPDARYPDATFVEDAAVLTERCAVITRPGAPSRLEEVDALRPVIAEFYPEARSIVAPGTLDGGDICEAGSHFFIGLSERTNEAGAQELARLLTACDYTWSFVDIRGVSGILHLKSGLAWLGEQRLVVIEALRDLDDFKGHDLVSVARGEEYAANCVRVNDRVLIAAGYPILECMLREQGYKTIALDMTEFQKMDGGLSCLSLRF
ncbi:MAG: amidinotransferase [Acidobacteria bacterium]|nr:amidinotransferase [Acidobacteriota bacterium]